MMGIEGGNSRIKASEKGREIRVSFGRFQTVISNSERKRMIKQMMPSSRQRKSETYRPSSFPRMNLSVTLPADLAPEEEGVLTSSTSGSWWAVGKCKRKRISAGGLLGFLSLVFLGSLAKWYHSSTGFPFFKPLTGTATSPKKSSELQRSLSQTLITTWPAGSEV